MASFPEQLSSVQCTMVGLISQLMSPKAHQLYQPQNTFCEDRSGANSSQNKICI